VSELTVIQRNEILTVVKSENDLILQSPGPQGPRGIQGLPGAAGGSAFIHEQTIASASWVINHNIGRLVAVILFDDDGNVVQSDVEHGTINQATVTWSSPTTGSALVL
jgi:hypothetical protein